MDIARVYDFVPTLTTPRELPLCLCFCARLPIECAARLSKCTLVVTYPSGAPYSSTYALVNGFSRETANTQPPGSSCSAATRARTYDANGNTASVVDLDGHLTCYANDLSTNFEKVRVEGLTSGATCRRWRVVDGPAVTSGFVRCGPHCCVAWS